MHDFRQADLAAGGQGAPITPIADWVLFRGERPRAIVNLGGYANLTALPSASASTPLDRIRVLMSALAITSWTVSHEVGSASRSTGTAARCCGGAPDPIATDLVRSELRQYARSGRSLGTGDELDCAWRS